MEWLNLAVVNKNGPPLVLARLAVEKRPEMAASWRNLGHLLLQSGDPSIQAEAFDLLQTACERFCDDLSLHLLFAKVARLRGSLSSALKASRRALEIAPQSRPAAHAYFLCLMANGDEDGARLVVDRLVAPSPDDVLVNESLIRLLLKMGRLTDAIAMIQSMVDRVPELSAPVYYLARLLGLAGRRDEALRLMDMDRFTRRHQLPLPEGFPDRDAFHRALVEQIEANPTLILDPLGRATYNGRQTETLCCDNSPAVAALLQAMRRDVDAYAALLPGEGGDHPFVRGRPSKVQPSPWAVTYAPDGIKTTHIHPGGWMTAVYYVANPPAGADAPHCGAIVLGGCADRLPGDAPWSERIINPIPGDLLLFPSWVPHYTYPTGSDQRRMCVPMDVVPVGATVRVFA